MAPQPKKITFFKNEESMSETATPQRPLLSPEKRLTYVGALNELVGRISSVNPTYLDVKDFCQRHNLKESFIDALRDLDGLCWDFKKSDELMLYFTATKKLINIQPEEILKQMRANAHKTAQKVGAVVSDDIETKPERELASPPTYVDLLDHNGEKTGKQAVFAESTETPSPVTDEILATELLLGPTSGSVTDEAVVHPLQTIPQRVPAEKKSGAEPTPVVEPSPDPLPDSFAFPYSLKVVGNDLSLYMDVTNRKRANLALQLLMLINDATE